VRVVCLRFGVILAADGGALARMAPIFRLGLGGPIAGGRQWMPWLHRADAVGLIHHAIATTTLAGPVNAVAPEAATNAEFTRALGHALHRPAILPVPRLAVRIGFGETSEVLLASQRAVPAAAMASGYRFRQPTLASALADALAEERSAA
jgi:uncharacterized protein (TIGR01777 family)